MVADPVIRFENISKRFEYTATAPRTVLEAMVSAITRPRTLRQAHDLWAVHGLDLEVTAGQCLGIVGRNGSGKSTVLKLITRIIRPTSGRLTVRGRVSALLELGAGFHPDLTGRENVYLNASVLGLSRRDVAEAFADIVAFSELGDFIDMPVKHYSSGMYMRLGFSVAIHVRPDVLIVDEVLAVGDQAFQHKCFDRIYRLKQAGITIVIVSHHAATIRNLCSHALWLDQGEAQAFGAVEDVLPLYEYQQEQWQQNQLSARRRAPGDPGLHIQDVRYLNELGQETTTFCTGETLIVETRVRATAPVTAPMVELVIVRSDGVQVATARQRLPGWLVPDGEPGVVRGVLPTLPLLPAGYQLKTLVYGDEPDAPAQDVLERPIRVQAAASSPAGADHGHGLIYIPVQWTPAPAANPTTT